MEYTIERCFLCDAESKQSVIDHGNRSLVTCSNDACGQYEITNAVALNIAGSLSVKEQFRMMVSERSN